VAGGEEGCSAAEEAAAAAAATRAFPSIDGFSFSFFPSSSFFFLFFSDSVTASKSSKLMFSIRE